MNTRDFTGAFRSSSSQFDYERIATGLGWFSIGLGLAEMLAPGKIAEVAGIREDTKTRTLLRSPLYGLREVAAGAGILTQPRPAGWLWARVAGDMLDLGSLALALKSRQNDRGRVVGAMFGVLGVTALDVLCAQQLSQSTNGGARSYTRRTNRLSGTTRTIWVNRSPEEAYKFWRNFENLPLFMNHLESVEITGDGRSRWRARGPLGRTFEWEPQTQQDRPNELIAWRSVENSEVQNSGSVFFERAPGGRGTIVRVELAYDPPGGAVGASLAKLLGKDADQMLEDDLRAFKQVLETGEVVYSDASIHPIMHPGQPSEEPRDTRPAAELLRRVR